jgi:hypothetical protein
VPTNELLTGGIPDGQNLALAQAATPSLLDRSTPACKPRSPAHLALEPRSYTVERSPEEIAFGAEI